MSVARTVVVVGDLILDRTTLCRVRGPSQEFSHLPIFCEQESVYSLGGAGNVAANLVAMGASVFLIGAVSDDCDGARLQSLVMKLGVPHKVYTRAGGRTTRKHRVCTLSGQVLRMDRGDEAYGLLPSHSRHFCEVLTAPTYEAIREKGDTVWVAVDYGKGFFSRREKLALVRAGERYGGEFLVDPGHTGPSDWENWMSEGVVFKANVRQCQALAAVTDLSDDSTLDPLPRSIVEHDPCDVYSSDYYHAICIEAARSIRCCPSGTFSKLVVTFGAGGLGLVLPESLFYGGKDHVYQASAGPVSVADPCGAGDTVLAALAYRLSQHAGSEKDWRDACDFAARAAKVAVSRRGVAVVGKEDLPCDREPDQGI